MKSPARIRTSRAATQRVKKIQFGAIALGWQKARPNGPMSDGKLGQKAEPTWSHTTTVLEI